jgi:hypothetical protein
MATFATDKYALGYAAGGGASGVYLQNIMFSTANTPGAPIPISQQFAQSDVINLCWIGNNGKVIDYHIEASGRLDTSAAVVFDLFDGYGTCYQSGITTSGGSSLVVLGTSTLAGVLGQRDFTSSTNSYLRLICRTAAGAPLSAARNVLGWVTVDTD